MRRAKVENLGNFTCPESSWTVREQTNNDTIIGLFLSLLWDNWRLQTLLSREPDISATLCASVGNYDRKKVFFGLPQINSLGVHWSPLRLIMKFRSGLRVPKVHFPGERLKASTHSWPARHFAEKGQSNNPHRATATIGHRCLSKVQKETCRQRKKPDVRSLGWKQQKTGRIHFHNHFSFFFSKRRLHVLDCQLRLEFVLLEHLELHSTNRERRIKHLYFEEGNHHMTS